ncbi:ImmA/IrrE family metallo-endopeptidase [Mycetohabitans sp. B8]|nr:ImmA/IrrE family metallo-endopeptidase [Mycetohabitans sp. B8]
MKPVIEFNASEPALRQRFTIAHELGHFALNHGPRFRDSTENFSLANDDLIEAEANKFAAELLMPAAVVNGLISKYDITDLDRLTGMFKTSTVAMKYCLKNLDGYDSRRLKDTTGVLSKGKWSTAFFADTAPADDLSAGTSPDIPQLVKEDLLDRQRIRAYRHVAFYGTVTLIGLTFFALFKHQANNDGCRASHRRAAVLGRDSRCRRDRQRQYEFPN